MSFKRLEQNNNFTKPKLYSSTIGWKVNVTRWTLCYGMNEMNYGSKKMNEIDYGLKEMNETDYGLKKMNEMDYVLKTMNEMDCGLRKMRDAMTKAEVM